MGRWWRQLSQNCSSREYFFQVSKSLERKKKKKSLCLYSILSGTPKLKILSLHPEKKQKWNSRHKSWNWKQTTGSEHWDKQEWGHAKVCIPRPTWYLANEHRQRSTRCVSCKAGRTSAERGEEKRYSHFFQWSCLLSAKFLIAQGKRRCITLFYFSQYHNTDNKLKSIVA